jgi:uncharacterized protein (TIRG00374 family)
VEYSEADQIFGRGLLKKLLWPLVIGVVAYAALLLYGDAGSVVAGFATISGQTILACFGLALLSFVVRWLRWQFYLWRIDIAVPLSASVLIFLIGFAMSITPGKVGEMLKSLLLKETADVPVARSMPIVVAERVTDLAALLAIGLVGYLWEIQPTLAVALPTGMMLAFFLVGRSRRLGQLMVKVAGHLPVIKRHQAKVASTHGALYELWHPVTYVTGMLLALVVWQLQAVIVVVFASALGDAPVSLLQAGVAYAAPLLAGSLALLPGGLGVTEASMAGVLRTLAGVSAVGAATLTIMVRVSTFWFAIALGFAALAAWRFRREQASSKPA